VVALVGYTNAGKSTLFNRLTRAEVMAKERSGFLEGATANGVDERTAGAIFDLMEKFAAYGFNKSHSAAYAWLAYQTAYLKANYPIEFMTAVLNGVERSAVRANSTSACTSSMRGARPTSMRRANAPPSPGPRR